MGCGDASWVTVQILLDIGLVGVMLWLSWRPNAVIVKQRHQLAGLLSSIELKIAQLQVQLQRAEDVLGALRRAKPNLPPSSPSTPLASVSPYEEVARLVQQGYTLEEVASRVKLTRGEVDLITHLKVHALAHP
jgi:hypothetical protein